VSKQLPTSILLDTNHHQQLERLKEWTGLNRTDVIRRAIRLWYGLKMTEQATAEDMGEHGPVYLRVVAELGSESVINKRLRGATLDCGPGLMVNDEFTFYVEPTTDALMAIQHVGGKQMTFRVEDGKLVAKAMSAASSPIWN
jgi:Ribbon-helix-helix protein, copG family